eukprot:m51a1_g5372 hypothetical protein (272) ;mRNA; f:531810-533076
MLSPKAFVDSQAWAVPAGAVSRDCCCEVFRGSCCVVAGDRVAFVRRAGAAGSGGLGAPVAAPQRSGSAPDAADPIVSSDPVDASDPGQFGCAVLRGPRGALLLRVDGACDLAELRPDLLCAYEASTAPPDARPPHADFVFAHVRLRLWGGDIEALTTEVACAAELCASEACGAWSDAVRALCEACGAPEDPRAPALASRAAALMARALGGRQASWERSGAAEEAGAVVARHREAVRRDPADAEVAAGLLREYDERLLRLLAPSRPKASPLL